MNVIHIFAVIVKLRHMMNMFFNKKKGTCSILVVTLPALQRWWSS